MKVSIRPTRREFLKSAVAASAVFGAPALLRSAAPNERLNLAFIGSGGRGGANLKTMTKQTHVDVNVVALCDVDQRQLGLIACKTGSPTGSPFSYAGPLTEANHLGNVAYRAGKKLEWDPEALRATNCPEAEQYLGREPRAGWAQL